MATLTPPQIAGLLNAAGWPKHEIALATAIVLAESGGRSDARGDTHLTSAKWGPSIGLFQIRSLNAERGKGTVRDELANLDPLTNAKHALVIRRSQGLQAWTVYNTGSVNRFMNAAKIAAAAPFAWLGKIVDNVIGDPIRDGVDAVKKPIEAAQGIATVGEFVMNPDSWKRLALYTLGFSLIALGFIAYAKNTSAGAAAIGTTKKAVKLAATKKVMK